MDVWHLLMNIVALLAACLLAGGVFSRLGQSPLVGYLLAGMVLGSVGLVEPGGEEIEGLAELGVSLLLFSIGLEFSWRRLRGLGGKALGSGAIQVIVTLAVAAGLALLFRKPFIESLAIGAMVALSSTACVLRVLMDRSEMDSAHGRNTLAILLVQDMAVVPLAVMMTVLVGDASFGRIAADVGRIALMAGGLILALYLLLNKLAVLALGMLTLERNRELTVLLAVCTGLGSAWAAHLAGISPALGAFVAGMFLGGSPFATQIRADVSSLRVVLLTLFFGAAGMVADPGWILLHAPMVLGVTTALIVGKAAIVWAILRAFGQTHQNAIATGLCLGQVGEFAFVLGTIALGNESIPASTYQLIVSATILSLFVTPFLVPAAPRIGWWVQQRLGPSKGVEAPAAGGHEAHAPHVVIIGFGPAGQMSARALADRNEKHVLIIDLNQAARERAQALGFDSHIGDASQADVLEHAHLKDTHTVVVTVPARSTALTIVSHVRRLAPQARIIVRARHQRDVPDFKNAGAHIVVDEEEQVGATLARRVFPDERGEDGEGTEE